jgi:signal transduction histidine kinase
MSSTNTERTKVLVVDDKAENLVAMEAILSDVDVKVITAQSGNDALGLMLKHDFALVLLDVQMPEMDGFETAQIIRSSEKTRNTPIIFLTALSKEQEYINKGYESGAVDYILKPLNPSILRHKVDIFKKLHEQNDLIKKQSEKLLKANKKLKNMYDVEHQARVAKDALIIEQSKLATLGQMIGYMTHQWKQPINILSLCFQDINETAKAENPEYEDFFMSVEQGMDQLKYMTETIDSFRNYLKPGKTDGTFGISLTIIDVIKLIGSYITKNGIKLKYVCGISDKTPPAEKELGTNMYCVCGEKAFTCSNCPVRKVELKGSVNDFKQVLINLINNSRDAIEDTNSDETWLEEDEIIIETKLIDDNIEITITDTAGGIPEEIQDRIFEPYFTTKKHTGTGIGLNMVKNILEDNFEGHLDFKNKEQGVEFKITLKTA